MTIEKYNYLKTIDTSSVYVAILNEISKKTRITYDSAVILGAYVLFKIQENNIDYISFEEFSCEYLSAELGEFSASYPSRELVEEGTIDEDDGPWDLLLSLKNKFSLDELAACVLFGDKTMKNNKVPEGLAELVVNLMNVSRNDEIANFALGGGSFIADICLKYFNNFYGIVCDEPGGVVSYVRYRLLDSNIYIYEDIVDPYRKFDRIFCQTIFQYRFVYNNLLKRYKKYIPEDFPEKAPFEWWYGLALMSFLDDKGKCCIICKYNSLTSHTIKKYREYFIDKGLVEQVVLLPNKLYETGERTVALVLSFNNKTLEFKDLSDCSTAGRIKGKKIDVFRDEDIKKILDKNFSRKCNIKYADIKQCDYNLDPQRYLYKDSVNEDFESYTLTELGASVFRAAQFTVLDMLSEKNDVTNIKCLMPGDIQNGVVVNSLDYLRDDIDEKYYRFKLIPGDVLITKNGNPFKIAVFDDISSDTIIANGNLYIIRCSLLKVDPYYIKAYFESAEGRDALEHYSAGNIVKMITKKALCSIKIPYYDFEKRQAIAVQTQELSESIKDMHNSILKQTEEMKNLFQEVKSYD